MPHIHTDPGQHDHTASAFIVRIDGDEPKLLLHMHKLLKAYLQIGGHVELHETPWQSITHEIKEESGYRLDQLQILQPSMRLSKVSGAVIHPQPVCVVTHPFTGKNHFHTDTAYAFVTDQAPADEVAEGESTELRFFTKAQLMELEADQVIEDIREIGLYVLEECLKKWEPVSTSDFD